VRIWDPVDWLNWILIGLVARSRTKFSERDPAVLVPVVPVVVVLVELVAALLSVIVPEQSGFSV
jgi:hypothetical protein